MIADSQLIKRLRIIIKASGGQSKFAKACGVSQSLVSLMLSGDRDVNFTVISAACHSLGYSPEWIILGTGNKMIDGKDSTKLVTEIQILRTEIDLLHARMRSYEKEVEELLKKFTAQQQPSILPAPAKKDRTEGTKAS